MTATAATANDRRFGGLALALAVLALGRWLTLHIEFPRDQAEPNSAIDHQSPTVPEPPVYTEEARRLLGELAPGDALAAGFVVDHVEGPDPEGAIRVVGIRDGQQLAIWLRLHQADDRPPPLSTARYDLFYDRPQPLNPPVASADTQAILAVLAERVRLHEQPQ